jgi:hypothetical protein
VPPRNALLALLALAALSALCAGGTWSAFSATTSNASSSLSSAPDWTAPALSAAAVSKSAGGIAGFVKQGGSYVVYANVTDSGNPASGIASVTADVSALTTGQTAVAMSSSGCPCSAGGVTYSYKSATLTANAALGAGSKSFTVSAQDAAGNGPASGTFSVTVDNTPPTGTDVQTANGGSTGGKPEAGDTVTLTYSEQIEPVSILAGWGGAAQNMVVRIANAGGTSNDMVTFWNAANTSQLPLGTVNLGRSGYVAKGATVAFGATGSASTVVQSGSALTITLGTPGATTNTVTNTTTMTWTPSASATDRAGNAASTTAATESGAVDKEF